MANHLAKQHYILLAAFETISGIYYLGIIVPPSQSPVSQKYFRRKINVPRLSPIEEGFFTPIAACVCPHRWPGSPPPCTMWTFKNSCGDMNNVGHPTRCPQPLNSVSPVVSYVVQCLQKDFFKAHSVQGGVPATCAIEEHLFNPIVACLCL